jgi:hypothetical protein
MIIRAIATESTIVYTKQERYLCFERKARGIIWETTKKEDTQSSHNCTNLGGKVLTSGGHLLAGCSWDEAHYWFRAFHFGPG